MTFLQLNPKYAARLRRLGLVRVGHFFHLPAEIVSGHTDRNVGRVTLDDGSTAFLKREHRVPWKDRFANALAGFGWVSKSRREAATLAALEEVRVSCPEWLAVGEDNRGRAFLLLHDVGAVKDLRRFAAEPQSPWQRLRVAHRLGKVLARLHRAGFRHADLYAKHVGVVPSGDRLCFLDWQRARRGKWLTWAQRALDLAALDATLPHGLVSARERLTCLRAYLSGKERAEKAIRRVRRLTRRLLRRNHIREERDGQLPVGTQSVLRLDEEALCVRPAFWAELRGAVPDWLRLPRGPRPQADGSTTEVVRLPGGRPGVLTRRRSTHWWAWLLGRPRVAAEIRTAGKLFRQERRGAAAPRVLAFGQRHFAWGRTESFLLTEPAAAETGRGG